MSRQRKYVKQLLIDSNCLSLPDLAKRLNIPSSTLYDRVSREELPIIEIGGILAVKISDITDIKSGRSTPGRPRKTSK